MHAAESTHTPTPEEIMEYVDGEGTPAAREAIAAHLQACATCQSLADEQGGMSRRMHAWNVDSAPASLRLPSSPERRSWLAGLNWRRPRFAFAGFSVAAIALMLIFMNVGTVRKLNTAHTTLAEWDAENMRANRRVAGGGGRAQILAGKGAVPAPAAPQFFDKLETKPSVIRTATLRLVTKDFANVRASVEKIVSDAGGFVDQMTIIGDAATPRQLRGTLRVPGERLTDALAQLRTLGQVVEDTQGAQDVSDQLIDLDARLASARATEKRLTELLQNRTGKLSDVLDVERELARVRLDIERLDAEKTNVGRRVSYAAIDVSISEERKAGLDSGPLLLTTRLRLAALDGLENALESAAAAVLFTLRAGPTLVLWGALAAFVFLLGRRFRMRDSG